jgi:ligand-binding SRPBCC domain-containing protein
MPSYESRMSLPGSAESVFDFLIRPANLARISPPEVQMAIVEAPEVLSLGSRLVFKIHVYGQVQQFEHEIVEFSPPRLLREKAIVTPMKSWSQEYTLEPGDHGEVILCNRIEFEPPGGLLGFIVTPDLIISNLKDQHEHRHKALRDALS